MKPMIIRKHEEEFILIHQHEHAKLSGDICSNMNKELFLNANIPDVVTAVYEHDRSWIRLDPQYQVNPDTYIPYSFQDYPLEEKIIAYTQGLDETEEINKYAGLLCSLHYVSFFDNWSPPESKSFIEKEEQRQVKILAELGHVDRKVIEAHLNILQFCDRLSLYVCLNDPGVPKNKEHEWYREGISHSESINPSGNMPIRTSWMNDYEVQVAGFPFTDEFETWIRYSRVSKEHVDSGVIHAEKIKWEDQRVIFRR